MVHYQPGEVGVGSIYLGFSCFSLFKHVFFIGFLCVCVYFFKYVGYTFFFYINGFGGF